MSGPQEGTPNGADRLAQIEQEAHLMGVGLATTIDSDDVLALVEIAKAARAQAEREPGALDTAIRDALARLDSGAAEGDA